MSNPYQTPNEETRERSTPSWKILSVVVLSAILFLAVVIFGAILHWRSLHQRIKQQAKAQAVMALQKAEAASDGE